MPFPPTESQQVTADAMNDPQVGDQFSETYTFYVFVVARVGPIVVYCEGSPPITFPDDKKVKWNAQHIDDFKKRFAYMRDPSHGYWVKLTARGRDIADWIDYFAPESD